jgi:glycosyltransferase involved in cell wall biosynthesis
MELAFKNVGWLVVGDKHVMRFVILSSNARSIFNFRGHLIKRLVDNGHDVIALAPDYDAQSRLLLWNIGAKPVDCDLTRASINPFLDLIHTLKLAWQIWRIKPDSILCYSIKPVIFGGIAAFLARVPNRVMMIEGLGYIYTYDTSELGIMRRMLRKGVDLLYKLSLSLQQKVIFLNQDDINDFVGEGLVDPHKAVKLGGIGVDLEEWALDKQKKPSEVMTFTFVGRLLKEKGVHEFIKAAELVKTSHPEIRFLMLGDIDQNPGSLSEGDLIYSVQSGLIEWPGHVDIKGWLSGTSVFVLPSYREGVPRSTQEAMAMGLPVITTDVPGCRETVVDGINGFLVAPRDHVALAKAMEKFIEAPSLINKMGKESRRIALESFDVNRINDRLIAIMMDKRH